MVESVKEKVENAAIIAATNSVGKLDKSGMCPAYKTIMVCGLLGSGKSTIINSMVGK